MRNAVLSLCALLCAASALGAERPASAHRLVRLFDFEERAVTTEPVPAHWVRLVHNPEGVQRPGFPPWNESGFSDDLPYRGAWSAELPTRGGSAGLRLAGGVVPVAPGADYSVAAAVRTRGLSRARAQVVARFLDSELEPIADSERESELLLTGVDWERVSVELWGDHPQAAWVQVDLLLLQPDARAGGVTLGEEDLARDDLSGSVWFDDVAIMQTPRLELTTNSPTNVVVAPERPTLRVSVRDLTGERLSGTLKVFDLDGRELASRDLSFFASTPDLVWAPELGRFGWFRARLDISAEDRAVGSVETPFVWAAPGAPDPSEARRFMLLCEDQPVGQLPRLPDLLAAAGAGGVQVGVPDEGGEGAFELLEEAVMTALERRFGVALQIVRVTERAARRLHIARDDVLALPLDPDSEAWKTTLEPALVRFGQRVSRWQVGAAGDDHSLIRDLPERRSAFLDAFERLSPEPVIVSPWSSYEGLPAGVPGLNGLLFALPAAVAPRGVLDLAQSWREAAPEADLTLLIEPSPGDARTRVRELTVRTLHAWETGVDRLAYRPAWGWSRGRLASAQPTPELLALRSLSTRLHGRRTSGRFPMPDGAHALLLTGPRGDALALWNEHADPSLATLRAYLGDGDIRAYDLYGNERPVERSGGRHVIPLSTEPIFVEGVDTDLLLFQSGVSIEPGFVVSAGARRELELVLTNPWPETMSGRVRIVGPERWRLAPSVQPVVIQPGQTTRLPFEISLGVAEEAGLHPIAVEAELSIGRETLLLSVEPTVEVGIEDLALDGGVRLHDSGGEDRDIVVVAIVTNLGDDATTLTISALAPGRARQQAPVSTLPPGESAIRQFRYPAAASEMSGQAVRLSVVEAEGVERLNRTLTVPE